MSRKYLANNTKITIRRTVKGTESTQTFDTTALIATCNPYGSGNDFSTQSGTIQVFAWITEEPTIVVQYDKNKNKCYIDKY